MDELPIMKNLSKIAFYMVKKKNQNYSDAEVSILMHLCKEINQAMNWSYTEWNRKCKMGECCNCGKF